MKTKRSSLPSQILILTMAVFVLLVMIQAARAQSTPMLAQSSSGQGQFQNSAGNQAQVLQIGMPQRSLGRRLLENTSLS